MSDTTNDGKTTPLTLDAIEKQLLNRLGGCQDLYTAKFKEIDEALLNLLLKDLSIGATLERQAQLLAGLLRLHQGKIKTEGAKFYVQMFGNWVEITEGFDVNPCTEILKDLPPFESAGLRGAKKEGERQLTEVTPAEPSSEAPSEQTDEQTVTGRTRRRVKTVKAPPTPEQMKTFLLYLVRLETNMTLAAARDHIFRGVEDPETQEVVKEVGTWLNAYAEGKLLEWMEG